MAERVFTNGLLFAGAANLTGQTRETALDLSSELQDSTSLEDTARTRVGGLKDVALSAAGYFDPDDQDAIIYPLIGVSNTLITLTPTTALGDTSFFFRAVLGEYSPITGSVGEIQGFTLNAASHLGDLYRGILMENSQFTVTGNGTGRQIGAVGAAQSIYAGVHVTAISGDWDIVVESDDNSGFTTAVTRATFSSVTTVGDEFASVAGAITDDWWRLRFVENSAGSITLAASLSIQ